MHVPLQDLFRLSLTNLLIRKLNSTLSIFSLVFGCGAFVATLTINDSSKKQIQLDMEKLGIDLVHIEPDPKNTLPRFPDIKEYILKYNPLIKKLSIELSSVGVIAIWKKTSLEMQLKGQESSFFDISFSSLESGRYFDEMENENVELVAVIGQNVKNSLFANQNPLGEYINISVDDHLYNFKVIGLLQTKKNVGGENDDTIFIPHKTFLKMTPLQTPSMKILGQLKNVDDGPACKELLKSILVPFFPQGVKVFDASDVIEQTNKISKNLSIVGIGLALISLLSGGVGIMNIMILSVTQRRREIGLRKALGANNFYILVQFLLESVIICLTGGIIGVIVGIFMAKKMSQLIGQAQLYFSPMMIILSISFSILVGIFFGIFPARQAAKLDPYEALRS